MEAKNDGVPSSESPIPFGGHFQLNHVELLELPKKKVHPPGNHRSPSYGRGSPHRIPTLFWLQTEVKH